jgi:pyruvate dehydrogenase E2 component (dihydrolipoamide acetyltransferase)
MRELKMPKFGLTMETGVIESWLAEEGDKVEEGEPILEVSTDKIVNEVQAPVDGTIAKIIVQTGEEKPVGALLAIIAEEGENVEDIKRRVEGEPTVMEESKTTSSENQPPNSKGKQATKSQEYQKTDDYGRIKSSPLARRLAKENNIDISMVKGTGPEGRVIKKNIMDALEEVGSHVEETLVSKKKPAKLEYKEMEGYKVKKMSTLRKKLSERLYNSYHSTVTITNTMEMDFTKLKKATKKLGISITSALIKLVIPVLKEFPDFNAHYINDELRLYNYINIGVAVDTEQGLVVPVLWDIESLPLDQINSRLKRLSSKAKERKLTENEIQGSTFSISNLGMLKTDVFTPVLNPPEVAILGVGRIVRKPVVLEGDLIAIRDMCFISLSYDHRIIDGADASRFLVKLSQLIESAEL